MPPVVFLGPQNAPKSLAAAGWGYAPDFTGELTALPRPPSWVYESLLLRPIFLRGGKRRG